jgi:hypothetical protein
MTYPWTETTMRIVNELTPDGTGTEYDRYQLRKRLEEMERALRDRDTYILTLRRNQTGVHGS